MKEEIKILKKLKKDMSIYPTNEPLKSKEEVIFYAYDLGYNRAIDDITQVWDEVSNYLAKKPAPSKRKK